MLSLGTSLLSPRQDIRSRQRAMVVIIISPSGDSDLALPLVQHLKCVLCFFLSNVMVSFVLLVS